LTQPMKLNNRVKFLRRSEKFNMTQGELAKALGLSRQTLSSIENGNAKVTAETMIKIAEFFGEDPRNIFFC